MSAPDSNSADSSRQPAKDIPWQLRMFSKTLKKRQKLRLVLEQIGELRDDDSCLLISCGDNNGALNYHFRSHGGVWSWVEMEGDHIAEMEELLGDPVLLGQPARLPAAEATFDVTVSIDVHEHLEDAPGLNRELYRVTKPGGIVVVTTPNGDPWKPVTLLKRWVGMTKETYGHKVLGYSVEQHARMLADAGLEPQAHGSYSKFFTEGLELLLNLAYTKVLSRRGAERAAHTPIAPASRRQLDAVKKQYRVYSLIFPALLIISKLDLLLFGFTGYAVSVVARKPG